MGDDKDSIKAMIMVPRPYLRDFLKDTNRVKIITKMPGSEFTEVAVGGTIDKGHFEWNHLALIPSQRFKNEILGKPTEYTGDKPNE